jgi:hypothetical protein
MDFEKLDRARIAAALGAAVITGAAALYGVYQKSREATAASYETLAPEINELRSDVEQLRKENQTLREALAGSGTRVPPVEDAAAAESRAAGAAGRGAAGTAEGRTGSRRPRVASNRGPATPATADGGATTATAPPPAPPPPTDQPPPAQPDVVGDLKKRVPIDFEKAIRVWKDVQEIRKKP